jgi:uncharacterized protein (PEP-CTERM system associated)
MAKRLPVSVGSAPLALLALLLSPNCLAEWKLTPTLDLRTSYSDNAGLENDALRRSAYIHEVAPGFALANIGPRLQLTGAIQRRYFEYSEDGIRNAQRGQTTAGATMKAHLVDELLFLDAAANQSSQVVSAFGAQGNDFANGNTADIRTWRISPYLRHQFGSSMSSVLRIAHDSVDGGNSGLRSSESDSVDLSLMSGPAFRRLSWDARLAHRRMDDETRAASTTDNIALNLSYALGGTFSLTGGGGYDKYDYDTIGGRTKGKSWQLGFAWNPSSRSSLSASAGKRYFGSTYMLRALHRSRRTVWNISYDDAVTTTRDQFLLPASIDTAAMLDRLFIPTIADPVARAQAVQAYIRATGLPASLANNINYFSNRFILQKQFQASAAFNTARTTSVLTMANTRRSALSTVQTDSPILGSNTSSLNDNVHQKAASAMFSLRVSPRSTVDVSLTANESRSNTTGVVTDNRASRIGMTRKFGSRLSGRLEARQVTGTALYGVGDYHENAISASLSIKL